MNESPLSDLIYDLNPSKQHIELIRFLSDDLGHTNDLLNLTDEKVAVMSRLVSGLFVGIITIILGLMELGKEIFDTTNLISWPGFFGSLGIGSFAWWLLLYSFRTIEIKQLYILRMNFLRREIHYLLGTKNSSLIGYWTADETERPNNNGDDSQINSIRKEMNIENQGEVRQKIGLDNLYPIGLSFFIYLFAVLASISGVNATIGLSEFPVIINSSSIQYYDFGHSWAILAVTLLVIIIALREKITLEWKHHKEELLDLEKRYSKSSQRPVAFTNIVPSAPNNDNMNEG